MEFVVGISNFHFVEFISLCTSIVNRRPKVISSKARAANDDSDSGEFGSLSKPFTALKFTHAIATDLSLLRPSKS